MCSPHPVDRNANSGSNAMAALPLHSPARSGHLRLPEGAAGAMSHKWPLHTGCDTVHCLRTHHTGKREHKQCEYLKA